MCVGGYQSNFFCGVVHGRSFWQKVFLLLYRSGSSISFPVFAFGESLYDGAGYLRIYGDAILGWVHVWFVYGTRWWGGSVHVVFFFLLSDGCITNNYLFYLSTLRISCWHFVFWFCMLWWESEWMMGCQKWWDVKMMVVVNNTRVWIWWIMTWIMTSILRVIQKV